MPSHCPEIATAVPHEANVAFDSRMNRAAGICCTSRARQASSECAKSETCSPQTQSVLNASFSPGVGTAQLDLRWSYHHRNL
eukprot:12411016-Karenia_brevis.AAC.1